MKTHNPAAQIPKDGADAPCIPRASSDPCTTRLPHGTDGSPQTEPSLGIHAQTTDIRWPFRHGTKLQRCFC